MHNVVWDLVHYLGAVTMDLIHAYCECDGWSRSIDHDCSTNTAVESGKHRQGVVTWFVDGSESNSGELEEGWYPRERKLQIECCSHLHRCR